MYPPYPQARRNLQRHLEEDFGLDRTWDPDDETVDNAQDVAALKKQFDKPLDLPPWK